jgi:hypothetical protein
MSDYDATFMMKCCGPAGAPSELTAGYRINGKVFLPVGLHRGSHQTWQCFEDVETGERFDYCTFRFETAVATGKAEEVPAMEMLALTARGE